MRLLIAFFRAYPGRTVVMLAALLLAGAAEGVSLAALLPLLGIVMKTDGSEADAASSGLDKMIQEALLVIGIEPTLGVLLVIIVMGITLRSLLLLFAKKHIGYTAAQVSTDLRLNLLRAIMQAKWQYFMSQSAGQVANSMAGEAARSSEAYVNGTTMLSQCIQAMVYVGLALAVSWRATLAAFAAGLVIIAVSHTFVRMGRRAGDRHTNHAKALLRRLTDTLQSVKPLKAMSREYLAGTVLSYETNKLNRAIQKQVLSKAALSAAQDPLLVMIVALGIYFSYEKFGIEFPQIAMLVLLLGRMINQMGKIQTWYQRMVTQESAYWSMNQLISDAHREQESLSGNIEAAFKRGIRLDGVGVSYGKKVVLNALDLEVPAGQLTAVIGPSGVGKTTVVDLVTGLIRPVEGEVYIDDLPLGSVDIKKWRAKIGYVPQENLLLHDSVFHNVTLGDAQLSEAQVESALRQAGAWEFVEQMPEGVHSNVGERGTRLSGGQRQRIMIARALAHSPELLILDEATSALDPASEAAICETLSALRAPLTILAISHQPAVVNVADRVYRIRDGRAHLELRSSDVGSARQTSG
jgi:ATP-binding cassette subfamily C protein